MKSWDPEALGKQLGEIERGQANRGERVQVFRGPATWSPAPEARTSRFGQKTTEQRRAHSRNGGSAAKKSLRTEKALNAALGTEDDDEL